MRLSAKCRYGLRAMIEIGKRSGGTVPVKRSEISRLHKISKPYLENIFLLLRAGNLIRSIRGAKGGFVLEKTPDNISLFDIVTALEGPIVPVECLEDPGNSDETSGRLERKAWKKVYDVQVDALRGISLEHLCENQPTEYVADWAI